VQTDRESLEAQLRDALAECARLRADNARLSAELARLRGATAAVSVPTAPVPLRLPLLPVGEPLVTKRSPLSEKVALFRRLFRGREDVYATRWEAPDGRAGYSPAARSRWHREQGQYLPLTDAVVERHLAGRQTVGAYPLLRDETCTFVAADFDKGGWREDADAYLAACRALDVPAALERSRSGDGGHVWVFFEAPVPAAMARRLGSALLARALEQRPQMGLDSYDRLFPNQDTLPRGRFGNLIALPLQRIPARAGNTLFVEPKSLIPYPDQWVFLSGLRRLAPEEVRSVVAALERAGGGLAVHRSGAEDGDAPWLLSPAGKRTEKPVPGPFPPSVRVTLGNLVYVEKAGLPPALLGRLQRLAAFQNPEFYRAQALRRSTFGIPRIIGCADDFDRNLGLPRGLLAEVRDLLSAHGIATEIHDERTAGAAIDAAFRGELTPAQAEAAEALLAEQCGVLCAPTAFGKTVVAAHIIAARGVSTLILVHRQILAEQWRQRLSAFLDLPPQSIGQYGGGRKKTSAQVDVALFQSLARAGRIDDLVAGYGQVIVDECHRVPAVSFERVLKAARARFVVGLTATPVRKDGHQPIIGMQCGPIRFRLDPKDSAAQRPFAQVAITRPTAFQWTVPEPGRIADLYAALATDEARNALICADVLRLVEEGRMPLLLTERTAHLDVLASRLEGSVQHLVTLRGGMGAHRRRAALAELAGVPEGASCVVLATGRYIGEGFDQARPDTLLLAMPVAWQGTLQQYAGRISRPHPGKREVRIYDYADLAVPVLARMHRRRQKGYRALGYGVRTEEGTGAAAE